MEILIALHMHYHHHHHHRLLRQKAAHKIQKTEYTASMNIKVAHILDQMLEDKSTQTTVRTYIKVTTHSPTHRHIHILAYTQADIMTIISHSA